MNKSGVLSRATRLLKNKRYKEVIRLLEPNVFLYRENSDFFTSLGLACLYTGDFGGAESYLKRAYQIDNEKIPAMLGLAVYELKRGHTEESIRYYLTVLDLDPRNRTARKGLETLRNSSDLENPDTRNNFKYLQRFFPPLGISLRPLWFGLPAAVIILLAALFFLEPESFAFLKPPEKPQRAGISGLGELPRDLTTDSGTFRYILEPEEITSRFEDAVDFFHSYQDNKAIPLLNVLINSNASAEIKQKSRQIYAALEAPDFTELSSSPNYRTVAKDPVKYQNSYVRWKGKATNIDINEERIRFDFLVGYQSGTELSGIIPVVLPFEARLNAGMSYEVLGKVIVEDEQLVRIEGLGIHTLHGEDN
ncbi:MAG: hypothetical protein K9L68_10870 [Spirochaetales bacterium]|nr:hypothetical protein [Spirochaetales bacterium]